MTGTAVDISTTLYIVCITLIKYILHGGAV